MNTIKSVLIAGAGAVGSTVASEIFDKNPEAVSILAGGERLERYRKNGLYINGKKYPFFLTDVRDSSAPDLIVIACKNHHLGQILGDIKNHVSKDTLILSLLNGITSEQTIADTYGTERVPYAMILGTDAQHFYDPALGAGNTVFSRKGVIHFGDAKNERERYSDRVRSIAGFFSEYGIAFEVPPDMIHTLWFKFMVNTGINQASAVLGKPYGPFQNNGRPENIPEARELMESAMREVIALSRAERTGLTENDIGRWYETLNSLAPENRTSMCQDVLAGRKTEAELFSGTVIALSEKHGLEAPVNRTLYRQLRTIEQTYGVR